MVAAPPKVVTDFIFYLSHVTLRKHGSFAAKSFSQTGKPFFFSTLYTFIHVICICNLIYDLKILSDKIKKNGKTSSRYCEERAFSPGSSAMKIGTNVSNHFHSLLLSFSSEILSRSDKSSGEK